MDWNGTGRPRGAIGAHEGWGTGSAAEEHNMHWDCTRLPQRAFIDTLKRCAAFGLRLQLRRIRTCHPGGSAALETRGTVGWENPTSLPSPKDSFLADRFVSRLCLLHPDLLDIGHK